MNGEFGFEEARTFIVSLVWTQPRIMALFAVIPIFNRQIMPGLLRYTLAAAFGAMVVPRIAPAALALDISAVEMVFIAAKEAFVGLTLGYLIAVFFWAFEAVGFLIDNQRGASISATLNPLTGNDTSPLGILFNQAVIVFFFVTGGFTMMLDALYDSFRLWDIFTWTPTLRAETVPVMLGELSRLVRIAVLLASPAIVAMFFAEIGLALISRFVPRLDVFFLAMPIKSALAMFVLIVYLPTLFHYAEDHLAAVRTIAPTLEGHWKAPPETTP